MTVAVLPAMACDAGGVFVGAGLQGTETILCLRNLITFVHQNLPEGIPDGPIVINYQNLHTIKQLSETYPISAPFTSASWGVIKRILPSF